MAKILKKLLLWLTSMTATLLFICFTVIAIFYYFCVIVPQKKIEKTQETPYDFINSIKITDDEIIIDEVPFFVKSAAAEALQPYIHQKMPDGFFKEITRVKKKKQVNYKVTKKEKINQTRKIPNALLDEITIKKNEIVVKIPSPFFESLLVGDILIAGIHKRTPDGLLRKIVHINKNNQEIVFTTEQASLAEALHLSQQDKGNKQKEDVRINMITLTQLNSMTIYQDHIVVNEITPFFSSLTVGEYLSADDYTSKKYLATNTFTRKITNIEHKKDKMILRTEPATLNNVGSDWSFHLEMELTPENVVEE